MMSRHVSVSALLHHHRLYFSHRRSSFSGRRFQNVKHSAAERIFSRCFSSPMQCLCRNVIISDTITNVLTYLLPYLLTDSETMTTKTSSKSRVLCMYDKFFSSRIFISPFKLLMSSVATFTTKNHTHPH